MKLEEFVRRVPNLRIARQEDNRRILDFYNSLTMYGGAFNIRFDKEPDYFKFLGYESDTYWVFYYGDDEGHIDGMLYMTMRPCYIHGKRDYVSHLADLRVRRKAERKVPLDWAADFAQLFHISTDIEDFNGCRYFLGSYVDSNKYAKKAFTDQTGPLRTSDIATYQMVSIIMRKPLKFLKHTQQSKAGMNLSISAGQPGDLAELKEFLDRQNQKRTFGFVFSGEQGELERRFRSWDDFSISSFYIVRNPSRAIIGCMAPWSTTKGRRVVVDKFPDSLEIAGNALKLFGKKFPAVGQELEILYLTHLEIEHSLAMAEKQSIFSGLLDALYDSGMVKQYHMLAYCDYNRESFLPVMEKDYVVQKTQTVLYQLHHPAFQGEVIREDQQAVHVGHEMCLT